MSFHALLSFFLIFPLFGFSFSRQLNDHQTRNLAAWSPYFSVPGDGTTFSLCAGEKVEISMAPTSSSVDSNVVCFGDPMLELFDSNGALVASNDNFLGNCPSILYPLNTSAGICENFHVSGRCVSGGCNGTAGIRITTNTCALENVGTAVPGNYPILDCELVLQLRTSICSLEGPWAIVSGGNYRNPCALDGGGYGCNSFSVWRSTQTFVCLNGSTQVPTNPTLSPTIAATYPPAFNRSASDELTFSFSATLAGSESHCETFFIAGDLNYVAVILNFPGARSSSWAADMAIGLSYGENSMQVGGYNSLFPGVGEKIPFPTSWRINQAGIYRVAYDISNYGFNGSALYNLCIMNGWTTSGAVAYSGTVSFSSTPPKGLNISTPPGENNDDNEGGDDEVGGDDDDGSSGGNYKNSFGVVRGDSVDKGILLSFYSDSYSGSCLLFSLPQLPQ